MFDAVEFELKGKVIVGEVLDCFCGIFENQVLPDVFVDHAEVDEVWNDGLSEVEEPVLVAVVEAIHESLLLIVLSLPTLPALLEVERVLHLEELEGLLFIQLHLTGILLRHTVGQEVHTVDVAEDELGHVDGELHGVVHHILTEIVVEVNELFLLVEEGDIVEVAQETGKSLLEIPVVAEHLFDQMLGLVDHFLFHVEVVDQMGHFQTVSVFGVLSHVLGNHLVFLVVFQYFQDVELEVVMAQVYFLLIILPYLSELHEVLGGAAIEFHLVALIHRALFGDGVGKSFQSQRLEYVLGTQMSSVCRQIQFVALERIP